MKMLTLNKYGKEHPISFVVGRYDFNGNLAVQMMTHENGYPEPWQNLTVNLGLKCEEDYAFIDTNNNGHEIIYWLLENCLGILTGREIRSGWCTYPEFLFFHDKLLEYASEV